MRGYPHPPLDAWVLALLLTIFGDVYEVPFHLAYIVFSLIAAFGVWSLARRFSDRPLLATLLCLATPVFAVNGNSFESDLPFLACWIAAVALFVAAVDAGSRPLLAFSALAGALAAFDAYQAVVLTPILAFYLWRSERRRWMTAWAATLAAPATVFAWQIFERISSGALPAQVLAGYMQSYGLETVAKKLENAIALTGHVAWLAGPLIAAAAFWHIPRWGWSIAAAAGTLAAIYDPNPLFWVSITLGAEVLVWCALRARQNFLAAWVVVFFSAALAIFFAGSQRYLLPIAAPVAILAACNLRRRWLVAGIALQLPISLGLAVVNYQHWDGYRRLARSLEKDCAAKRVWVNAEWGLRYYLEAQGALPLERDRAPWPGDLVVTSALSNIPVPGNAPIIPLAHYTIGTSLPLRLIALHSRSAYSAVMFGLRPFDISTGPIDRVDVSLVAERKPVFEYLDVQSADARPQVVGGIFPDGWMEQSAVVVLKKPETPMPLQAVFYLPPQAAARKVTLRMNGITVAEETYHQTAAMYTLASAAPRTVGGDEATVTLTVDKTFHAPNDERALGVVLVGIGFHR
jgi:4-amino-4-deoxy-L-arabinose transferase-like glycosyltransferase